MRDLLVGLLIGAVAIMWGFGIPPSALLEPMVVTEVVTITETITEYVEVCPA